MTRLRGIGPIAALVTLCVCVPSSAYADAVVGWLPILNAKYSYPQDWSVELGTYLGDQNQSHGLTTVTGYFMSLEPGGNGMKVNAGYGNGSVFLMGVRVGASYYQAWRASHGIDVGDRFIGLQTSGAIWGLTASLGAYYDIDNGGSLLSAGIGIGW